MTKKLWALPLALAALSLVASPACGNKKTASEHGEEEGGEHAEGDAKHAEDDGVLKMTPEKVANARIQLGKVERREQAGQLETTAQIEAPTGRQAKVGPRIPGRATSVSAEVGDTVRRGELLAVIDSPEVGQAKADFLAALA